MPLLVICPSCKARYQLKDELAGRTVKCKKCSTSFAAQAASNVQPAAKAAQPAVAKAQPAAAKAVHPASKVPPPATAAKATKKPAAAVKATATAAAAPAAGLGSLLDDELGPAAGSPKPALVAPLANLETLPGMGSLLDQELASGPALKLPASTSADQASQTPAEDSDTPRSWKCTRCESVNEPAMQACTVCGWLRGRKERDFAKEDEALAKKEWIYVLGATAGALAFAPILFWGSKMVLGIWLALFITALEIKFVMAVGGFALACRIFRQQPPEVNDIFRVTGASIVPADMAIGFIGSDNVLVNLAISAAVATVIGALMCMFNLDIPVFPAIGIAVCYNLVSTVLGGISILILGLLFLGEMKMDRDLPSSEDEQPPVESEEFQAPGFPDAAPPGKRDLDDEDARAVFGGEVLLANYEAAPARVRRVGIRATQDRSESPPGILAA